MNTYPTGCATNSIIYSRQSSMHERTQSKIGPERVEGRHSFQLLLS